MAARKKIVSFMDILKSAEEKTNLLPKIKFPTDIYNIKNFIMDRVAKDEKSISDSSWLKDIDEAVELVELKSKAKNLPLGYDSYNVQYPLLLHGASNVGARMYNQLFKTRKFISPVIIGKDSQNLTIDRINRIITYISYCLLDNPESEWLSQTQSACFTVPLNGMQIRQVNFVDPENGTFNNPFISPKHMVINARTELLSKAPAITKKFFMSHDTVIEKEREGLYYFTDFAKKVYEVDQFSLEDTTTEDTGFRSYKFVEVMTRVDLDGDGYSEPYLVTIDISNEVLLRIVSCIDTDISTLDIVGDGKINPIKLLSESYFADFHYQPDPKGHFLSLGLAHCIGCINKNVNEIFNIILNTAYLQTKKGGLIGRGARGAESITNLNAASLNAVDANIEDIKKSLLLFDYLEPSPVLLQLIEQLIRVANEMMFQNEALSGIMPTRELPNATMSALVEQSLLPAQDKYERFQRGITKELQIIAGMIYKYGSNDHYRKVLNDPEADIKADFNPHDLRFGISAETIRSTRTDTMLGLQILQTFQTLMDDPAINKSAILTQIAKQANIDLGQFEYTPEQMKARQESLAQPDPTIEVANKQVDADIQKAAMQNQQKNRELDIKEEVALADIAEKYAQTGEIIVRAGAPAEEIKQLLKQVKDEKTQISGNS